MDNEKNRDRSETVIERLLSKLDDRRDDSLAQLTPAVYERLRQLGRRFMRRERDGHTLQPTEVVHEALARVQRRRGENYNDTRHFYATVATHMRWVLVEYARHRRSKLVKAELNIDVETSAALTDAGNDELLIGLHDALIELEARDAALARICELHYFGGHTLPEIAKVMEVSETTVGRRLRLAKAWLATQMAPGSKPSDGNDG